MATSIFSLYRKLQRIPLGRHIFNIGVGFKAPFFGKIRPNVVELKPTFCRIQMKDRWGVRNHIGTVNAGALCTLAEITGGLALDATIPVNLRWIPKGMTVSYLAKGIGTLEAVCSFDGSIVREGEIVLPIVVKNGQGGEVFSAEIIFYISKKKT